jgi:hypothetical protein
MERNTKRLAEQAKLKVEPKPQPTTDPTLKIADESEALLN